MGHRRQARATGLGRQFAPRPVDMLRSPAMAVVSLSGRRVLDRLEIEMADHGGTENGRLPCTFADFHHFGIDRDAIGPALREVEALGFVERTQQGTAGNREFRQPNLWRLTYRPTDRAEPTHEWERIKTPDEAAAIVRAARLAKTERKTKTSRGKPHVSIRETPTETHKPPVGETPTTVPVGETPTTLDILGRGAPTPERDVRADGDSGHGRDRPVATVGDGDG
jgi:hypothetical protein